MFEKAELLNNYYTPVLKLTQLDFNVLGDANLITRLLSNSCTHLPGATYV